MYRRPIAERYKQTQCAALPGQPSPSHDCPEYVTDGQSVNCTCGGDVGSPPGVAQWQSTQSSQLTVTSSMAGQRQTCHVIYNNSPVSPVYYTVKRACKCRYTTTIATLTSGACPNEQMTSLPHQQHLRLMMMAHSSKTRIFVKVGGQFLHAGWWLQTPILDAHILLHIGHTEMWVEDEWDAVFCLFVCLFCFCCCCCFLPPAFFLCGFMPLCLELTTGLSH